MDARERLKWLRDVFYHPPGHDTWYQVCYGMEGRSLDPGMDMALEYALEHLQAWPDELRTPTEQWLRWLEKRRVLVPAMRLVKRVELDLDILHRAGLTWLLQQERIQGWTQLYLKGDRLGDHEVQLLAQAQVPRRLTLLGLEQENNLARHPFTPRASTWRALQSSPRLMDLEELHLSGVHWSEELISVVERSPWSLQELHLQHGVITQGQLARLLGSPMARGLRRLLLHRLHHTRTRRSAWDPDRDVLTPVAKALAAAGGLPELEELQIQWAHVSPRDVRALVDQRALPGLRHLALEECALELPHMEALCQSDSPQLVSLSLRFNELSPEALLPLLEHPWREQLQELHLSGAGLGDQGLGALLERGPWERLRVLWIDKLSFDSYRDSMHHAQVMPHLSAENFPALEALSVHRVDFDDFEGDVLEILARLPRLRALTLPWDTKLSQEERKALEERAQRRACKVGWVEVSLRDLEAVTEA